jgi:hypothetical protein
LTRGDRRVVEFTQNEFLKIEANRPDFVGDYQAEISVKKATNFLGAYRRFDPDSPVDTVPLAARAGGHNHPEIKDDVREQPKVQVPGLRPFAVAQRRGGIRTVLSVLQIVCLTVVGVGAVVCIVGAIVNHAERDDAEAGLLGGVRGGRAPLSRFAGILPYAVPWGAVPQYGGMYQPPARFAFPQPGGGVGFPAAQFPQTPEGQQPPVQEQQPPPNA